MKLMIMILFMASGPIVYAAKSCVPTPNETMCVVAGGTYDVKTKMCCIDVKK